MVSVLENRRKFWGHFLIYFPLFLTQVKGTTEPKPDKNKPENSPISSAEGSPEGSPAGSPEGSPAGSPEGSNQAPPS